MLSSIQCPTFSSNLIRSVGIDMIALHRLHRSLNRHPHMFNKLCHPEELPQNTLSQGLGLLWAGMLWTGKEAVAKCLKTGVWREGIAWTDLSVGSNILYQQLIDKQTQQFTYSTQAKLYRNAKYLAQHTQCQVYYSLHQTLQKTESEARPRETQLQPLSAPITDCIPQLHNQLQPIVMLAHAIQFDSSTLSTDSRDE